MAKAHDRILELKFTVDESDDDVESVDSVKYFRDRGKYDADEGEVIEYSAETGANPNEITLGEMLPPPTHIILTPTFQA